MNIQSAKNIDQMIGNLVILGFDGTKVTPAHPLTVQIQKYHLSGVILFDHGKNITNPRQLQQLTKDLQHFSSYPLLIAIDEEGGRVARLRKKNGFSPVIPSPLYLAQTNDVNKTRFYYGQLASKLSKYRINCNLAPSVDLAVNPNNKVIVKNKRSFGDNPNIVTKHAAVFIEEMRKQSIITAIKHFPGHGSSNEDSHKGFVDVSKTWSVKELEPFQKLIEQDKADIIMTAHIYNKKLDANYPATLSYQTITELLREKLNYDGVIITDDLQMKAISDHYTLRETLQLAINAGNDLLLFTNQTEKKVTLEEIIREVKYLIKTEKINIEKIYEANVRIEKLKSTFSR